MLIYGHEKLKKVTVFQSASLPHSLTCPSQCVSQLAEVHVATLVPVERVKAVLKQENKKHVCRIQLNNQPVHLLG